MKWLPIFKTGKWKDLEGRDFEATSEKLDKIVQVNQGRNVPITIGHPKVYSPWGAANTFRREGNQIFALPNQLSPEFVEWEKKKVWNKISISLNNDLTINHIAFLGGPPPVVPDTPMNFSLNMDIPFDSWATMQTEYLQEQITAEQDKQKMLKARLDLLGRDDKATLEEVIKGIASASPKQNR